MFQTHDNFAYLEIMAIKLSQSHGETTYYKSLRSSYLKVMAKQFTRVGHHYTQTNINNQNKT
jgi:hypothetical protein